MVVPIRPAITRISECKTISLANFIFFAAPNARMSDSCYVAKTTSQSSKLSRTFLGASARRGTID